MNKVILKRNLCLKYIVPFRYSSALGFAELCNSIDGKEVENNKFWKRATTTEKEASERDIYTYIQDEFLYNPDDQIEKKNGISWKLDDNNLDKEEETGIGIKLRYYHDGFKKAIEKDLDYLTLTIDKMGLHLFRNKLGFIWYTINIGKMKIDADTLVQMQYKLKELNYNEDYVWCELFEKHQSENLSFEEKELLENEVFEKHIKKVGKNTNKIYYFKPFCFGEWIANTVSFLEPEFFAKRKNCYNSRIDEILEKNGEKEKNIERSTIEYVPDKALLFTYIAFEKQQELLTEAEKDEYSYYFTSGYKPTYRLSDEVRQTMKKPFRNVTWNATKQGCSILAWPDSENYDFFTSPKHIDKIQGDYFTLYLKCLYQEYSLLSYAEKIQNTFPVELKDYDNPDMTEKLTRFVSEISLFLSKSMATSVSHIDHQNRFYIYLKERLNIHEDVKSVMAGLETLEKIQQESIRKKVEEQARKAKKQEEKRLKQEEEIEKKREDREKESDERISILMLLFSLLTLSSVLIDSNDLLKVISGSGTEYLFLNCSFDPSTYRKIMLAIFILVVIVGVICCWTIGKWVVNCIIKVIKKKINQSEEK